MPSAIHTIKISNAMANSIASYELSGKMTVRLSPHLISGYVQTPFFVDLSFLFSISFSSFASFIFTPFLFTSLFVGSATEVVGEMQIREKTPSMNVIFTDHFVLLIPRSTGNPFGISLNSLAFGGSFFAKTEKQLENIKEIGLQRLLQEACFPPCE
jgi:hypothetical protein